MRPLSPNAQFISHVFEEVAKGNRTIFLESCHDDVVWRTIGDTPWSGEFVGKQTLIDEIFRPLNNALVERRVTATRLIDGDDAIVVQARGQAVTRDGHRYDNDYVFVIHVENGKIVRYEEYCDTALIARILPDRVVAKSMHKPG
jgi:uncharacterized protein